MDISNFSSSKNWRKTIVLNNTGNFLFNGKTHKNAIIYIKLKKNSKINNINLNKKTN